MWGQAGWMSGCGGYVRRVFLLGTEGDQRSCRGRAGMVLFKGDDIFLNTPALVDYLQQQLGASARDMSRFMMGEVIRAVQPNRLKVSKYFVPDAFYIGLYPPYAGGGGVVYSGLLTKHLHLVSKMVHLYPIDDVYVGMCLLRLNANPSHLPAFLTFDFPKGKKMEWCTYHKIILVHKRTPDQVVQLWVQLKERQPLCCNGTLRDKHSIEIVKPFYSPTGLSM
ncbi:unnamed protein product [Merluccius merluccius]